MRIMRVAAKFERDRSTQEAILQASSLPFIPHMDRVLKQAAILLFWH